MFCLFFPPKAGPPDQSIIPENDVLGVTVVLITCSFRNQEFVRVGYYVNNEYEDPVLRENPPSTVEFAKVCTSDIVEYIKVVRVGYGLYFDNTNTKSKALCIL